jgi:hypothetical protein
MHFQAHLYCNPHVKVKGKLSLCVINKALRHDDMEELRYRSTYFFSSHFLEVSGQLHVLAALI